MNENPYQTPKETASGFGAKSTPTYGRAYVNQVPVIATLLLVQGVFLFFMAVVLVANGVMLFQFDMFNVPEFDVNDPEAQEKIAMVKRIAFWVMGGMGAAVGSLGVLHIAAGIMAFQYRGRTLGIVALVLGLGAMLTCYCAPTAIGLAIYGMIIYMHPGVKKAFEMKQAGMTNHEIQSQFTH